jgi:hypothetical protein
MGSVARASSVVGCTSGGEPTIWFSDDGARWTAADTPPTWTEVHLAIEPDRIVWTRIFGLVATGDRQEGSGYGHYVAVGPNLFP